MNLTRSCRTWLLALVLPSRLLLAQVNVFPSSGNVGIGTTDPQQALEVNGVVQVDQAALVNGVVDTAPSGGFWLNFSQTSGMADELSGGGSITFRSGNSDYRMVITSSGNVGIRTTNPNALLDVNGSGAYEQGLTVGFTTNIGINNGLILGTAPKGVSPSGGQGAIQISSNDSSNPLQGVISLVTDPTGANRRLVIEAIEQGIAFRNVILAQDGGNVGIGTIDPAYPLSVNGTVEAKEVLVQTGWSDYVFNPAYRLAPLSEVEAQIKAEGHLPGIPSAKEVAAHGVNLGDMEAKLLAKVEELTLRQIEQQKRMDALEAENRELRNEVETERSVNPSP